MPAQADFDDANLLLRRLRSPAAIAPDDLVDMLTVAEDAIARLRGEACVLEFRLHARSPSEVGLEVFGWAIGVVGFLAAATDAFVIHGELGLFGLIDLVSAWLGLVLGAYMRQRAEWDVEESRYDLMDVRTLLDAYQEIIDRVNNRLSP